ncbi:putative GARP complex subunit, partial [Aureobasidium melanogenum]
SPLPHRPGIANRSSSLSLLTNGSTDSLPAAARYPPAHSNLRNQLDASPVDNVSHPLDVLRDILAPVPFDSLPSETPAHQSVNIGFGELSLQEFADAPPLSDKPSEQPSVEEFEKDKGKFEDLHKSIVACDEVLKSVENYLTSFQADLAAVSAEIETLQNRSSALNTKLETRKQVEKLLAAEVDALTISPSIVRKISDGPIDDAWIKALEDLEKRSKIVDSKAPRSKSAAELKPLIDNLKNKAVERTRDYVVSQIKALRAPGVNAQLLQQNNFMRYKDAFQFLDRHQPQLGQEIGRAYINTMRWFYLHNFSRYKASLDKMNIHVVDKNEVLAQDDATKRITAVSGSRTQAAPHDAFSLGRRMDMLKGSFKSALSSHIAEEDKSAHYLEVPFRAFNLALMDNASGEY